MASTASVSRYVTMTGANIANPTVRIGTSIFGDNAIARIDGAVQAHHFILEGERQIKSTSDLDHAVFKTSIEDLSNLWLAKYGVDWINKEVVTNDEFFGWAVLRLKNAGKLEEHRVWEPHPHTVMRLIQ